MRDLKYIVKRILIGVGIVLVLGFINSAKASALSWSDMEELKTFNFDKNSPYVYTLYYDSSSDRYYIKNPNNVNDYSKYIDSASNFPYYFAQSRYTTNGSGVLGGSGYSLYFLTNNNVKYAPRVRDVNNSNAKTDFYLSNNSSETFYKVRFFGSSIIISSDTIVSSFNNNFNENVVVIDSSPGAYGIAFSNFNIYNFTSNDLVLAPDSGIINLAPKIESLQAHKNIQQGVLFSYQFSPKFSNWDTTNYKYQWKFGHNSGWNDLEENEQLLNFKNNGELYVRIVQKSDNSVIDNENFVVYGIGQLSSNSSIYDIIFTDSYNSSTENHSIIVDEVKTDIEFIPDSDRLRYQYKFVPDGETASNVVWTTSATNKISYTTTENGTIYARITDSEYNTSYEETHTIPKIGKIGLGQNNSSKTNNFFQKLTSQINYGGPVSSLFIIPVNALTILYSNMSDSNTCSPIQLGSLLGTNMQFDCYNFKGIVGNEVYNIIDVIFAFVLTIGVFKFILKLYNDFISMKEV